MKCMAVMSMPRLCFKNNIFCAKRAFEALDIPLVDGGGASWKQGLSQTLKRGIDEGFDCAFALDYDAVFGISHVKAMLDIMEELDWVDILVPLQSRQYGSSEVLFQPANPTGPTGMPPPDQRDNRVARIATGHFGLTPIRLSALAKIKKPWFQDIPDPDGDWGKRKTDADMAFWANWRDSGREVYLANQIRIGHMQLMVTWPGIDLRPYNIPIEQWDEQEGDFA